jgi:hypothetical protein
MNNVQERAGSRQTYPIKARVSDVLPQECGIQGCLEPATKRVMEIPGSLQCVFCEVHFLKHLHNGWIEEVE